MNMWSHVTGPDKCPLCGSGKKRTTQDFILLAKEVHGDRYDYSQSAYVNATTKVKIICYEHGEFTQIPDMHCFSDSQGCPHCKASKGEKQIYKILKELNVVEFVCEHRFSDLYNSITDRPLFFDFFIPQQNILIEYDGESHFKHVNYSGNLTPAEMETRLQQTKYLDNLKNQYAIIHEYTLIRISYTEFNNIEQILKKQLIKV
jgi:very-short-patch-repair endonuclease